MGPTPEGINVGCGGYHETTMHHELSFDSGGHVVAEEHVLQHTGLVKTFEALYAN